MHFSVTFYRFLHFPVFLFLFLSSHFTLSKRKHTALCNVFFVVAALEYFYAHTHIERERRRATQQNATSIACTTNAIGSRGAHANDGEREGERGEERRSDELIASELLLPPLLLLWHIL